MAASETVSTAAGRANSAWRTAGRRTALLAGMAAAAGTAVAAYGWWEKEQFTLREETLRILPPGAASVRVLHLSDIHFIPGQSKKARWLGSLAELAPDLVVNTGDNLSHRAAVDPLLSALKPLFGIPGVHVPGSNDYYAPRLKNPAAYLRGPSAPGDLGSREELDWQRLFEGFGAGGWISLSNRAQSLNLNGTRFDFTGVDDPHLNREVYAGWPRGGVVGHDAKPHLKVAIAHAPYQRVLDHFTDDGAQLILAGHTHGGQLCLPGYGALVSNCDLPTWRAKGLTQWENNGKAVPLNVSGGIGASRMAPIRIACKPEAVLLTLTASA